MEIRLTEKELIYLKDLAKQRNAKEAKFGAMTYGGKQGSVMAHFIGLVGEYAVAKSAGYKIDTRIFDSHGDDGIDILEEKWGVKTTTYCRDPYLRVEVHHFNAEIQGYVLCAYNPRDDLKNVDIVGWASKDKVINAPQRTLRRGGPLNYILKKDELCEWICKTS